MSRNLSGSSGSRGSPGSSGPSPLDLTSTWGVDAHRNPGIGRFRRQLDAEAWANDLVLQSLATIPESGRASPCFARAMQLLPHIQLARGVWLSRLKGEKYDMPAEWFPPLALDETRAACDAQDSVWRSYLDSLKDEKLPTVCRFASSDGTVYTATVEDILIHVFNHSTYHRGQIARLVAECGGQRAGTDYIAFGRRAEEPRG